MTNCSVTTSPSIMNALNDQSEQSCIKSFCVKNASGSCQKNYFGSTLVKSSVLCDEQEGSIKKIRSYFSFAAAEPKMYKPGSSSGVGVPNPLSQYMVSMSPP